MICYLYALFKCITENKHETTSHALTVTSCLTHNRSFGQLQTWHIDHFKVTVACLHRQRNEKILTNE